MKKILILIIVVLASALYFHDELKQIISPPEVTVKYRDLIERDGLRYQEFSEVPFTGKVTGIAKGSFKNGKREGEWIEWQDTGPTYRYKSRGNYKNGKREGAWVYYDEDRMVLKEKTGTYKNGKKISD